MKYPIVRALALLVAFMLVGCVAFRSGLQSEYQRDERSQFENKPVNVLFHFTHLAQTRGLDAIPKIVDKNSVVGSFDNLFNDALMEIGNLGEYATFTDDAGDVNCADRRALRDSLIGISDYTMDIRFSTEKNFAAFFLGGCLSTVSLTLIPVPYRWTFKMETTVRRCDGAVVGTFLRTGRLANWVEALLIVAYPFSPEVRKREEIYIFMLHDTFRQIEHEGILSAN